MTIRLLMFISVWLGVFLSGEFLEELSNFLLPVPLILFFILLSSYMKSLFKNDITYEKGWKSSALMAFMMGASITLPFAVFRVTPEGPVALHSIIDYLKFVGGVLVAGTGFGLISMLIGVIYINQFYPQRKE